MTATATLPDLLPANQPMTPSDLALTPQQLQFMQVFGFLRLPGLMLDCIEDITAAFESMWRDDGNGSPGPAHDGTQRSCIPRFMEGNEYLSSLLQHPRIHGPLCSLLGEDFNYMGSDGNLYVGDTGWHRDGWHQGLRHMKVLFYLDPLTRNQGALRVIPGTHIVGDAYARDAGEAAAGRLQVGVWGDQVPAEALEVTPGDVLIFNHNLFHAAFGGSARRRMFTINCSQRYAEGRLPELQEYLAGGARFLIDRAFQQRFIDTADRTRLRHIEQPLANDFLLSRRSQELRLAGHTPANG